MTARTVEPIPKKKPAKKRPKQNYMKQADALFAAMVRSRGVCEIKTATECNGYLQCCHGLSRGYKAVRCDFRNAFCGCARHHQWWTAHPEEWSLWRRKTWGDELHDEILALALTHVSPDWKEVAAQLRAEAKAA